MKARKQDRIYAIALLVVLVSLIAKATCYTLESWPCAPYFISYPPDTNCVLTNDGVTSDPKAIPPTDQHTSGWTKWMFANNPSCRYECDQGTLWVYYSSVQDPTGKSCVGGSGSGSGSGSGGGSGT
jgi:hypothetical protein